MRIIAGAWRGHRLTAVGKGDEAARLRPTPDRVRESLFSILAARGVIEDAHVLDLFAGTGALGLEALSRGAAHTTFVEQGRTGQRLIDENIKKLAIADQTTLLRTDATRLPPCDGVACNLVFLDPPYGKGLGDKALQSARARGWLAPDVFVVLEENTPQQAPDGFAVVDQRRFGSTHLTFLEVP